MVEMGHKDTGFPIETLGSSHDTSTFISFNNLFSWPDENRAKFLSLPRRAGVATPTTPPLDAPLGACFASIGWGQGAKEKFPAESRKQRDICYLVPIHVYFLCRIVYFIIVGRRLKVELKVEGQSPENSQPSPDKMCWFKPFSECCSSHMKTTVNEAKDCNSE